MRQKQNKYDIRADFLRVVNGAITIWGRRYTCTRLNEYFDEQITNNKRRFVFVMVTYKISRRNEIKGVSVHVGSDFIPCKLIIPAKYKYTPKTETDA